MLCADLIIFRGPGIKWPAEEEFSNDAAQRPHINGLAERQTQNDLRSSVTKQEGLKLNKFTVNM